MSNHDYFRLNEVYVYIRSDLLRAKRKNERIERVKKKNLSAIIHTHQNCFQHYRIDLWTFSYVLLLQSRLIIWVTFKQCD